MALYLALISIVVVVGKVLVYSYLSPSNDFTGRIEVQAHRGGMGMRSEESLWVSKQVRCTHNSEWTKAGSRWFVFIGVCVCDGKFQSFQQGGVRPCYLRKCDVEEGGRRTLFEGR